MTVLRESPWYNEILKEGHQKGRQEEAATLVIRQLVRRLGALSEVQVGQIQQLSISNLEELGEALLDFTDMADLERHLG